MRFLVNRKEFINRLDIFLGLVDNKDNIDTKGITNHFVLDSNIILYASIENNNINLVGANSKTQISVITILDATVTKEGKLAINPHLLKQILNEIKSPEDSIEIKSDKVFLIIQGVKLRYIKYDTIPSFPKATDILLTVKCDFLKQALDSCVVINEIEEKMSILNNLCIFGYMNNNSQENKLFFCSSARTSISLFSITNIENNLNSGQLLLNKNILTLLFILCTKYKDNNISIYKTEKNKIAFLLDDYYILMNNIYGEYPDILPLFNTKNIFLLQLSTDIILSIFKKISILNKKNAAIVEFVFDKNILNILFKNSISEVSEDIELPFSVLQKTEISFNYLKLLTILNSFGKDDPVFNFSFGESSKPLFVSLPSIVSGDSVISKQHIIIPARSQKNENQKESSNLSV